MRKLTVFIILSLNGHYKDANNSLDWHHHNEEGLALSLENLRSDGETLLFGGKTYREFAGFWATDYAFEAFPEIAERMQQTEKIVFSRSLKEVAWENSRLAQTDLITEVRKLKNSSGGGMTVLGSGSIVRQLASDNLIDDYLLLIDPVVLSRGTPLFEGVGLELTLHESRAFKSGAMLLHYRAKAERGNL